MTKLAFKNEFMTAEDMQDYGTTDDCEAFFLLCNVLFHADWIVPGTKIVVRCGEQFDELNIDIDLKKNETKYTFWKKRRTGGPSRPDIVVSKSTLY